MDAEKVLPQIAISLEEKMKERLVRLKAEAIAFPEIFSDYKTGYLRSPLWRDVIRPRVLERDKHICQRCFDAKATQVHHRAYTVATMKGQDDSLLISLCAKCHRRIERDNHGQRRETSEKERVLRGREEEIREDAIISGVRNAAASRCFRCNGKTDTQWTCRGEMLLIPTIRGEEEPVWACTCCSSEIHFAKDGRLRSVENRLKLLRRRPVTTYTLPSQGGFRFTKAFRKMNAMRQEGAMNEFEWNHANKYDLAETDAEKFAELKANFELTRNNGRQRRTKSDQM